MIGHRISTRGIISDGEVVDYIGGVSGLMPYRRKRGAG